MFQDKYEDSCGICDFLPCIWKYVVVVFFSLFNENFNAAVFF